MATKEKLRMKQKCCGKLSRHIFKVKQIDFSIADCTINDVQYQVFKNNSTKGEYYTERTIESAELDPEVPFTVLIHGWLSNGEAYWYEPYRKALFQNGNNNLVCVDWEKSGGKWYDISAANAKYIGAFIADFIIAAKVNLKQVHIVGHSLGAQAAGFLGKRIYQRTGEKVARITLTDPSALGFELPTVRKHERACDDDADFVDVIHSDMGHYGCIDPIGHVDFYPNGGKDQPGCPDLFEDDDCSRARSNLYFIESITSDQFQSAPSESFEDFLEGNFEQDDVIVFGYNCPTTARGVYYFATNDTAPFAKGEITAKIKSEPSSANDEENTSGDENTSSEENTNEEENVNEE